MGTQPEKHKVFKVFFQNAICRASFSDHFRKQIFSIGQFFFMLLQKYCQSHARSFANLVA